MKEQIILWMSRASVCIVATILCFVVSLVIASILGDGLGGIGENTDGAHFVSCILFSIAFCLWLYG